MTETKHDFMGRWLVTELIYEPWGEYLGQNRQERILRDMGSDRIEVRQICRLDPELKGHAVAAFEGEWVFELQSSGRARRYVGPDVVGVGLAWGDQAMLGRGVWPRFGASFSSFAFLAQQDRQLTGGHFGHGPAAMVSIAAVGVEAGEGHEYPLLEPEIIPAGARTTWLGTRQTFSARGDSLDSQSIQSEFEQDVQEGQVGTMKERVEYDAHRKGITAHLDGSVYSGFGARYGPLLEWRAAGSNGLEIEAIHMSDPAGGQMSEIRKHYRDQQLRRVEIDTYHSEN
jgi:hypothetical protein